MREKEQEPVVAGLEQIRGKQKASRHQMALEFWVQNLSLVAGKEHIGPDAQHSLRDSAKPEGPWNLLQMKTLSSKRLE